MELPEPVVAIQGAGRVLYALSETRLFRFDADAAAWTEPSNLPAGERSLLAVEASGGAVVRAGDQTYLLDVARTPRVLGLDQNAQVHALDLILKAAIPSGALPTSVSFRLGALPDRAATEAPYSPGGVDREGLAEPVSLVDLPAGPATLVVRATYPDGMEAVRTVPFHFDPRGLVRVSFDADIKPIYEARCQKCHEAGPGRTLSTLDQWKADAPTIVAAIKDRRMPADGPLEPASIDKIQRWVVGGMQP